VLRLRQLSQLLRGRPVCRKWQELRASAARNVQEATRRSLGRERSQAEHGNERRGTRAAEAAAPRAICMVCGGGLRLGLVWPAVRERGRNIPDNLQ
jgi:hypothetical protein